MANLFEGLKEGDLEELVIPLVSIDEYESKLDDDSIVIAFHVQDREPANDLNRFVQKGPTALLDTDVSPAPNADGFYMVFVEILRDEEFPQKVMDILGSLEGLTGIADWRAVAYGSEEEYPLNLEFLQNSIRLASQEPEKEPEVEDAVDESLTEFFRNSDLENLVTEGRMVTFEGPVATFEMQLVDMGAFDVLQERNAVLSQGLRLDEAAQHNVSRIQALLGDLWVVEHLQNHVLLSNVLSEDVALFRLN